MTEQALFETHLAGKQWVAIDPGESCGIAWVPAPSFRPTPPFRTRMFTATLAQTDCEDWFHNFCYAHPGYMLIIEEYRVYPDKALSHSGKKIPTAECIGALKYIARYHGMRVIEQQAAIKKPMAGMLEGRGIQLTGKTRHAKDAELHLWYHALREEVLGPPRR